MWEKSPDQLDRYRRAVDDDRTDRKLVDVVKATRAKGLDVEGHGTLKTAPRATRRTIRGSSCSGTGLIRLEELARGTLAGEPKEQGPGGRVPPSVEPLTRWLQEHVGESTTPEQSRA
jgi:hypothetical protein